MKHLVLIFCLLVGWPGSGLAQSPMQHVDLTSPDMTQAEMTREEVMAALATAATALPTCTRASGRVKRRTR